jgi:hypothetical protein
MQTLLTSIFGEAKSDEGGHPVPRAQPPPPAPTPVAVTVSKPVVDLASLPVDQLPKLTASDFDRMFPTDLKVQ